MGPGLRHPSDLDEWQRWQSRRHRVRSVVRSSRRGSASTRGFAEVLVAEQSDIVVAVEATHASLAAAVVAPVVHLPSERTTLICPPGWQPPPAFATHERRRVELEALPLETPRVVLAAGHYTPIGKAAYALAQRGGIPFVVSQHGALTPLAPPLPQAAHLASWSEADAAFWLSGRTDITLRDVGSQLLWEAGANGSTITASGPLTYLGQLHAAELPRHRLALAALAFCQGNGADYRPHPSERDILSRATHVALARTGITIAERAAPLRRLPGPVVSVFSTGVLEAAASGRPAWVHFLRPPAWLSEFWERYGMRQFRDEPTPPPGRPHLEPARRIADLLLELS